MTVNPHPIVLAGIAQQRCADLQAQVDRERLASLTQRQAGHRQSWAYLSAVRTLGGLLALLFEIARND